MALTSSYMQGRMSYLNGATRPQALLFANTAGTLTDGYWVPTTTTGADAVEGEDFIILSDHNRAEINIGKQRIETRQRMVNANMRSYWVADKLTVSTSWNLLPSRAFSDSVAFDVNGNVIGQQFSANGLPKPNTSTTVTEYTVDGGAGGVDLLSWYETHPGPFYVYLAYDKFRIDGIENYDRLRSYNQVLHMYFSSFEYSIQKRSDGFDFWNINIGLEEV